MSNCKTIAVCNQKGGVGKTTTTVNLGVGLAMQGKKVLLIDADPQGDLTTCLGWRDSDSLSVTLTEKLQAIISEQEQNPFDGILHHKEKVDLVPSNLSLSSLEMTLVTAMSRESVLKNYLSLVKDKYDYVLIDCMPSLGMITFNALTAADSVIIPVQAQYLPAKGMTQLLGTIAKVRKHTNADLKIDGILLTLVDGRTNLAKSTVELLSNMKKTAYFINSARTATTNEEDVLDLLREKKIAGAAFDVYGKEPLSADSPYLELENTELLPHIGGSTYNAIAKHSKMCFEAVRAFTENTKIDNRVV